LCVLWQLAGASSDSARFFFSTPLEVLLVFSRGVMSGNLLIDFAYTAFPTVVGFALGVTAGSAVGFALVTSRSVAEAAEWNVLVLGSIPIFAIAPMMIVWFGIGMGMKVAMAVFSTFFVAISQAYRGGRSVSGDLRRLFALNCADEATTLRKLVLPMSLDWVFGSLRLNANLALLGVFVSEYMASERGLGHAMLQAGSLYRVADVLAAALAMMILVVLFDQAVAAVERRRFGFIQWFAVDADLFRGEFREGEG
jgi:NitT/TauT family transport system permease protein